LSSSDKNYDVTRKKLLAVVYGLKQFKQYLMGRRFIIRTDHAALQRLRKTSEPMGQLSRWVTFMEYFDFDIRHRPGVRHGNADGLSRRPGAHLGDAPRVCAVNELGADAPEDDDVTLVKGRFSSSAGEPEHSAPVSEHHDDAPIERHGSPTYEDIRAESGFSTQMFSQWDTVEIHDDVLYRRWNPKAVGHEVLQLLLPASHRHDFWLRRTNA